MKTVTARPEFLVGRIEEIKHELDEIAALIPGLVVSDASASELLGVAEVAEALGVQPALISVWYRRDKLPAPVAKLAATPVWTRGQIDVLIRLSEHLTKDSGQADA